VIILGAAGRLNFLRGAVSLERGWRLSRYALSRVSRRSFQVSVNPADSVPILIGFSVVSVS